MISRARLGLDGPKIVLTILVLNFRMSLVRKGMISQACRSVAFIMVATTRQHLSKSPCTPCTLSSSVDARPMRLRMRGPEVTPSVVCIPDPSDLNAVSCGKGTPCSSAGVCVCLHLRQNIHSNHAEIAVQHPKLLLASSSLYSPCRAPPRTHMNRRH